MVIRDHNGSVIASRIAFKKYCFGALAAELVAIKEGLIFALTLNCSNFWIDSLYQCLVFNFQERSSL